MKPCTLGPKHKWEWIKNRTVARQRLNGFEFTLKGVYKCKCGAVKYGPHRMEAK